MQFVCNDWKKVPCFLVREPYPLLFSVINGKVCLKAASILAHVFDIAKLWNIFQQCISAYCIFCVQVTRTLPLTDWATTMDLSPTSTPLIAIGNNGMYNSYHMCFMYHMWEISPSFC